MSCHAMGGLFTSIPKPIIISLSGLYVCLIIGLQLLSTIISWGSELITPIYISYFNPNAYQSHVHKDLVIEDVLKYIQTILWLTYHFRYGLNEHRHHN